MGHRWRRAAFSGAGAGGRAARQGRAGSVCPSICLSCRAGQGAGQGPSVRLFVCLAGQGRGQGPSVRLSLLQDRAGGRARRAGQGPNKE